MKTAMDKFLHNSFFNYLRMTGVFYRVPPAQGKDVVETIITIFATLLLLGALSMMSPGLGSETILLLRFETYIPAMIYGVCIAMGTNRRKKPSLINIAPISYKKRVVYSFLSSLFTLIVSLLIIYAIFGAAYLLTALIALAVTGEWVIDFNIMFESYAALGVQGSLFIVICFMLLYGAGMLISYIKNREYRFVLSFAVPVAMLVFAFIIVNVAAAGHGFVSSWNVILFFEKLPLSWLWLTVVGAVALGICAVSVIFAVKSERPKEY